MKIRPLIRQLFAAGASIETLALYTEYSVPQLLSLDEEPIEFTEILIAYGYEIRGSKILISDITERDKLVEDVATTEFDYIISYTTKSDNEKMINAAPHLFSSFQITSRQERIFKKIQKQVQFGTYLNIV